MPDPMPSIEAGRVRRPGFDSKSPPAEPSGRSWRLWSVLPVCAGFAVFGVVVWMAYQDASLGPPGGEPPLIRAAPEAIKLPPDQADEEALAAEEGEIGRLWSDGEQADLTGRQVGPLAVGCDLDGLRLLVGQALADRSGDRVVHEAAGAGAGRLGQAVTLQQGHPGG